MTFADWPGPGPIDLNVHDRPHASASTEWWYVHTHLETEDKRPLSLNRRSASSTLAKRRFYARASPLTRYAASGNHALTYGNT